MVAVARQLGMAVMQCVYYGHNTPGRPFSHISSLIHPSHLPEICPFSHCKVDGCKGNHIERSAEGGRFTLHVPHSKTSASMVGPISYPFSASLVPWLEAWLMFGWPIVAKQVGTVAGCCGCRCGGGGGACGTSAVPLCADSLYCPPLPPSLLQGTTTAFCTLATGVAISPSRLTSLFKVGTAWQQQYRQGRTAGRRPPACPAAVVGLCWH